MADANYGVPTGTRMVVIVNKRDGAVSKQKPMTEEESETP